MLTYLGGQTVYDTNAKKSVLYLGLIELENSKKEKEIWYSIFNGRDLNNVDGTELSHIFVNPVDSRERTMFYGDYCTLRVLEDFDEDEAMKLKKEISSHLRKTNNLIKNKKLFIKNYKTK
jgi:hypothetical protein